MKLLHGISRHILAASMNNREKLIIFRFRCVYKYTVFLTAAFLNRKCFGFNKITYTNAVIIFREVSCWGVFLFKTCVIILLFHVINHSLTFWHKVHCEIQFNSV